MTGWRQLRVSSVRTHLQSSLFINTYLLIAMRVMGAGFGFAFWAFAGRMLRAEDVGFASGTVSAAVLLSGLAQLGLGYGLVRYLSSAQDPKGLVNSAFAVSGLAAAVLALVFLLGLPLWSPALLPLHRSVPASLMFFALVLSTTLTSVLHWGFLAVRRLIFSLIKQVSQSILAVILLVGLRLLLPGSVAATLAYTLATILSLCWAGQAFLPLVLPGYRVGLDLSLLPGTGFASYSLKSFVLDQFPRAPDTLLPLLVINLFGAATGGHFFIVWSIARIVVTAASVAQSLFAEGANEPRRASAYTRQALKWGFVASSGLALVLLLCGRFVLSIIGPQYAEQGASLLYLVALAGVPETLVSVLVGYLRVRDRLRAVFMIMMLDVGGGLLLSYLGMQWKGVIGVGGSWLLAQLLTLAACGPWLWKQTRGGANEQSAGERE